MAEYDRLVERLERAFGASAWARTLRIVDRINRGSDQEIVVATARKAICIVDLLVQARLVRADKVIYASSVTDIQPEVFAGAEILVVEDLVTSTRSLTHTLSALAHAEAKSTKVIGYAVHQGYPAAENLSLEDDLFTPRLSAQEAMRLSEVLLGVLDAGGRSYNIDWPVLHGNSDRAFLDRLTTLPGWSSTRKTTAGGISITFYPNDIEVQPLFVDKVAIPKVRLNLSDNRSGNLQLLPIVALDSFEETLSREVRRANTSLPNGWAAAPQFAQYNLSLDLAGRFIAEATEWLGSFPRLRESARTLLMSFGPDFATAIRTTRRRQGSFIGSTLVAPANGSIEATTPTRISYCSPTDPVVFAEASMLLSSAFYEYYVASGEEGLRQLAAKGDVQANEKLIAGPERRSGLSIASLEAELRTWGYSPEDAAAGVSAFLDNAIDTGLVVPTMTPVGRRFRPGEAAMFNNRAKRLCEVILRQLASETGGTLNQFVTQKALVALWKHAAGSYLQSTGSDQLVSVQFYRHGAVLGTGGTTKIAATGNLVVTNVLETMGVIIKDERAGYRIPRSDVLDSVQSDVESQARSLGSSLARMLPPTEARWKPTEELIWWLSTADLSQAPVALVADIELSRLEAISAMESVVRRVRTGAPAPELITRLRRANWHQTLAEGWHKCQWVLNGNNERFAEFHIGRSSNVWEKAFLEGFVERVRGSAPAPIAQLLLDEAIDWLIQARLLWDWISALGDPDGRLENLRAHVDSAHTMIAVRGTERPSLPVLDFVERSIPPAADDLVIAVELISTIAQSGARVVDSVEAAARSVDTLNSYLTMTSAVVFITNNCQERDFIAALRRYSPRNRDLSVIDFSRQLNLPDCYAVAASGTDSAKIVTDLAVTLTANSSKRFPRSVVFPTLRSDYVICRASDTGIAYCEAFRRLFVQVQNLLPQGGAVNVIASGGLVPSLRALQVSGERRYLHEIATQTLPSGLEMRTFRPDGRIPTVEPSRSESAMKVDVDLLLFAPMPVERAALFSVFDLVSSDLDHVANPLGLPLFRGQLRSRSGRLFTFAIAPPRRKGPAGARDMIARALDYVNPRNVVVGGIAGAIRPGLDFGDVVVARLLLPYEYRKEGPEGTDLKGEDPLPVSPVAENMVAGLEFVPAGIYRPDGSLAKVFAGIVASGDTVVRSDLGPVRRYLLAHSCQPDVTEMEAGSIGWELASRGQEFMARIIVVRGVSDFADPDKDDSFHDLASSNAFKALSALLDFYPLTT